MKCLPVTKAINLDCQVRWGHGEMLSKLENINLVRKVYSQSNINTMSNIFSNCVFEACKQTRFSSNGKIVQKMRIKTL